MQMQREFRNELGAKGKKNHLSRGIALKASPQKGDALLKLRLSRTTAENERYQEQYEKHHEQNFGNPCRRSRDARKAQKRRDERDDQKDN